MKATSSLLSILLAAPLLSSLAATSPVSNTRNQQIVFADVEDATRLDDSSVRQGDLVDSMIAEAKSKGQDLSSWGIDGDSNSGGAFLESVDLNDEIAKAKLMWEAAMEDSFVTIQPIKNTKTKTTQKNQHKSSSSSLAKAQGAPGSGWVWKVCGSGQEAAVLHELEVSPDPPVAGKNLTVKAKGIVNSLIDEGTYADVVVKLGFIRLLSRRFDICQLAIDNDAELKCPLEPGEYEITHTAALPKEIPPAVFHVHVNGKTQDDVEFVCTDLTIDFMHH